MRAAERVSEARNLLEAEKLLKDHMSMIPIAGVFNEFVGYIGTAKIELPESDAPEHDKVNDTVYKTLIAAKEEDRQNLLHHASLTPELVAKINAKLDDLVARADKVYLSQFADADQRRRYEAMRGKRLALEEDGTARLVSMNQDVAIEY